MLALNRRPKKLFSKFIVTYFVPPFNPSPRHLTTDCVGSGHIVLGRGLGMTDGMTIGMTKNYERKRNKKRTISTLHFQVAPKRGEAA